MSSKCILCNKTRPTFNLPGQKKATHCGGCKLENMVDIKNPKCKLYLCDTRPSKKYKGYCLRCFINLFPNEKVSRNYKTKELTNNLALRNSKMTKEELEISDNAFANEKFSKWAEKQDAMEVGRVIIQSTHNASYGVSPLGDIMKASDTNQYRKKNEGVN